MSDRPTKRQLEIMRELPIEYNYTTVSARLGAIYWRLIDGGYAKPVPSAKLFHRKLIITEWGQYYLGNSKT